MRNYFSQLFHIVLVILPLFSYAQTADIILKNGKIFTSDTARLYAEAIAIKGERIIRIGKGIDVEKYAGATTKVIDLKGATVIPGINDAHEHMGYGEPFSRMIHFNEPMLAGPSLQQALDSLTVSVAQVPPGTLIQGYIGLRLIEDPLARRAALDKVAPNHPVIFNVPWGHGTILNSKAMQMLGIEETSPDPVGGRYERASGSDRLTGLFIEYAEFDVKRKWHSVHPDEVLVEKFREYADNAMRMGITSVQNMATSLELDKMVSVLQQSKLPIRIRVIRFPGTSNKGRDLAAWTKKYPSTALLQVSGMKWILDGTPLERGALMRTAYTDRPDWKGTLNFPLDTINNIIREGLTSKEQLLLHIVGDHTPDLVLSSMEKMAKSDKWKPKRVRFEHADGLMQDQWTAAKRMGVVVVVNPSHFMFAEVNHARVGEERAKTYQPLKSLIEAGIPVAIGSDGPNNPFLNIMFAAIHPTNPAEAISREQGVIAYTRGSAFAEFREKEKGMLKEGMLADLAVLSRDVFTIPLQELPGITSVLTMVGGKVVYDAGVVGK